MQVPTLGTPGTYGRAAAAVETLAQLLMGDANSTRKVVAGDPSVIDTSPPAYI